MGEQEKTHKPTHMAQAQGGLLEIQTRARFESGVMKVTYSQHVSIILVAQSHVISQKKKKYCNRSDLPSSWNQPATGPQDNSTGMSSLGHLVNAICTTSLANPRPKTVLQIFNQGILKHGAL